MSQSVPVNAGEIERAREVMAELAVYELASPQPNPDQQVLVLGNYLITCAMSAEYEDLAESFAAGLTAVGADSVQANELGAKFTSLWAQRYIFSLSHIPKDYRGNGIKRRKNNIWLDENEFVSSILGFKKEG